MNRKGMAVLFGAVALVGLMPERGAAAEATSCVDNYLSCINVASQESGDFWRSAKEFECGVDYYACMRRKVIGA